LKQLRHTSRIENITVQPPHANARKEFLQCRIDGQWQRVCKLIVEGKDYGVCAVLSMRIKGKNATGITIEECEEKMGLNGLDNGRLNSKT